MVMLFAVQVSIVKLLINLVDVFGVKDQLKPLVVLQLLVVLQPLVVLQLLVVHLPLVVQPHHLHHPHHLVQQLDKLVKMLFAHQTTTVKSKATTKYVSTTIDQLTNQPTNQPTDQPTDQPTHQLTHQLINQNGMEINVNLLNVQQVTFAITLPMVYQAVLDHHQLPVYKLNVQKVLTVLRETILYIVRRKLDVLVVVI